MTTNEIMPPSTTASLRRCEPLLDRLERQAEIAGPELLDEVVRYALSVMQDRRIRSSSRNRAAMILLRAIEIGTAAARLAHEQRGHGDRPLRVKVTYVDGTGIYES